MKLNIPLIRRSADRFNATYAPSVFIAIVFLMPLKLSLTYALLIPSVLLWLISHEAGQTLRRTMVLPFIKPLVLFVLLAIGTAFFGLRPVVSIGHLAGLLFFLFSIPFFVISIAKIPPIKVLLALLISQSIASYHSLLQAAFPAFIHQWFIGTVSESGQLTLVLPLALAITVTIFKDVRSNNSHNPDLTPSIQDMIHCVGNLFLFGAFGFSEYFGASQLLQVLLAIATGAMILNGILVLLKQLSTPECNSHRIYDSTLRILLPALLVALLVNLKRGPWLGVTLGLSLFLIFYYRKVFLPLMVAAIVLVFTVSPIRERLAESSQHFYISGGRSTIWSVGIDLSVQYPLGVGFDNSSFLREFAPEIPPELVHFHNNFLNILVETGWLGFILFLWWIYAVLRFCFSSTIHKTHEPVIRGIGCAILAWQTAGLVEYNFGDSEVFLMVLLILSMLVAYSENGFSQFQSRTKQAAPLAT